MCFHIMGDDGIKQNRVEREIIELKLEMPSTDSYLILDDLDSRLLMLD